MNEQSTDLVLVGAGPIGLELAVALHERGIDNVHIEAGQIGRTIARWPRNTRFFSAPERVAICALPAHTADQQSLTGEQYLAYLRTVVEHFKLEVRTYERVVEVARRETQFHVTTRSRQGERRYLSRRLVLATGDMARSHRIGVKGEDLAHVCHTLTDPHEYFQKRLLVVGGGNSALEAALRCYRAGARVTLSYRRREFDRNVLKPWLAPEVTMLIEKGVIGFLPGTVPLEITETDVALAVVEDGEPGSDVALRQPADFVLMATGYEADMSLFRQAGVELDPESEKPRFDEETMETNVPGLYVVGTAASGNRHRYELFIQTCHEHVGKVVRAITGEEAPPLGSVPSRNYPFRLGDNHPG